MRRPRGRGYLARGALLRGEALEQEALAAEDRRAELLVHLHPEEDALRGVGEGLENQRLADRLKNTSRAPISVIYTPSSLPKCLLHSHTSRRLFLRSEDYHAQPRCVRGASGTGAATMKAVAWQKILRSGTVVRSTHTIVPIIGAATSAATTAVPDVVPDGETP